MDTKARQVKDYLVKEGLQPQFFPQATLNSVDAANAIGCSLGEIAKSILMVVGTQAVLVVSSGDSKVKSGRLKQATGLTGKVRLPDASEVLHHTGYLPGCVCPFLLPKGLNVFVDTSLQRFNLVYPAAATGNSLVAVSFSRLVKMSSGKIVEVCDIKDALE